MNTKIKLRSFTLTSIFLVLFLILVSSVASASICETRLQTMEKQVVQQSMVTL